ncbi:hypothetical protein [Streptomyces sp. NPDC058145]|uniref:hypothetical protein n=1 Tax=Streptomyces sp. NPDC058145 TaxID=3346356 RepID=UPI0036EA6C32
MEEFSPLLHGERVGLTGVDGNRPDSGPTGDVWTEFVVPRGAETVWTYADGLTAGRRALSSMTWFGHR